MSRPGRPVSRPPLVVAVVGAGPSGLYAVEALFAQDEIPVHVVVLDRLPVPFGLVRYGVAPDHASIRSIRSTLQRTLGREDVRFYGNVHVGETLSVAELRGCVDAVVYAYGAASDRRLGVPGEDLEGSIAATELVAWYCGHPDQHPDPLAGSGLPSPEPVARLLATTSTAVVVGVGNVALDVVRILSKSAADLNDTDMAEDVLAGLGAASLTDVHVLGRRGPAYTAFTTKELRELGQLPDVDIVIDPDDLVLDESSAAVVGQDKVAARNLVVLHEWADRRHTGAPRRIWFHFWTRPARVLDTEQGDGRMNGRMNGRTTRRVSGVEVERTALDANGFVTAIGGRRTIDAELVVRAVGYRGLALPGVPYDATTGRVPHAEGRVIRDGALSRSEYVTGWIKRGPTGVIGTNKHDASETIAALLADVHRGDVVPQHESGDLEALLIAHGARPVDLAGWHRIDAAEIALGRAAGRPRTTLAHRAELLAAAGAPLGVGGSTPTPQSR